MTVNALSHKRRQFAKLLAAKRGILGLTEDTFPQITSNGITPLSFAQMGLWYHDQLHPNSPLYNIPVVVELQGKLDTLALQQALNQVVDRHQVLRSVFRMIDGEPRQVTLPQTSVPIPVEDLSHLPYNIRLLAAMESAERSVRTPMNLSDGPLFHARLIKIDEQCSWLLVMTHHIVFDGWSRTVLMRELAAWYRANVGLGEQPLPLQIQYSDFANWQRSLHKEEKLQLETEWWVQNLKGAPVYLALPTDRPRPAIQSFNGNTCTFTIDPHTFSNIETFAGSMGVTTFTVMTAALKLLLYRLTGQSDLVVSTGVATRNRTEFEPLIGCFINILLLRTQFAQINTCVDLIQQVYTTSMEAFTHQDLPFDRLVGALAPKRDLSYNPLSQVMIVYHNDGLEETGLPGIRTRRIMPEKQIAQYDLLLHLRPIDSSLYGMLEYSTDLFDKETVDRFCEQYMHVIRQILTNHNVAVADVQLLPPNQVEEILHLNHPVSPFPDTSCIHHLIEQRVAQNPKAPAVETANAVVSYGDINRTANMLAHQLQELGVGRGDIVGISLERTPAMVVALLAIVKCGAAYVPIDPNYPHERVRFIVSDSQTRLVITEAALVSKFEQRSADVALLCIDLEEISNSTYPAVNLDCEVSPDDLLYLIYTSGSTGTPKGVMLDHRGRVNNFHDFNKRFDIGPGDRLLAISSLSFDMCAYDVFGTLMSGGSIVLPSGGSTPEPEKWAELIRTRQVTIWHSAPALLSALLDLFEQGLIPPAPTMRLALLGGDWIPLSMPDKLRTYAGPQLVFVSLGGATEVSMDSTIYVVNERDPHWNSIPYGVAMTNQTAYVLDERMCLTPRGVAGELYLGGIGVGWGYFRRPELTATRFVPNPYDNGSGDRIYRTGDIARWTNAGTLELLGRADFQVKINGVRIELGEIDAALAEHSNIKSCVTSLYKPANAPPRLVSYVVTEEQTFDWEGVRKALFDRLPAYMVPRQHVILDRLPLSPNGKVLRTALPAPEMAEVAEVVRVDPDTVTERTLFAFWTSALGHENFGIDDDFFNLGGSSLQAAIIVNKVPYRLSLLEFMKCSTIRQQAKLITGLNRPIESRIFRFPSRQAPRMTLLCVPYAGGSAIAFRGLAQALPPDIATAVVAMPRAENGGKSTPTIEEIAEQCLKELSPFELENLAVYGHCAGTALAYELTRQLEKRGQSVTTLFLAAAMPPGVPRTFSMARETKQEIVDFVAALGGTEESGNADDWKVMVGEFQRDGQLVRDYNERNPAKLRVPLNAPLVVLIGNEDPLTHQYQSYAENWQYLSTNVEIHEVIGGHYFVNRQPTEVSRIVASRLSADV